MARKEDQTPRKGAADGTARRGANSNEILPPMVQAAQRGQTTITGADTAWMSPGNPMQGIVPDTAGRQYDYPVATNLNIRPRSNESTSFADLRALADAYYLVRIAIESRKDQLVKLKWQIKPIDKKAKSDARCEELTTFFKSPDKRHNWQEWMRMLVEDVLVIDAPAIYFHPNYGDKPFAFEIIDGATIKVLLDQYGRTPIEPDPAYQQNIKGVPTVNYTSRELIYKPRNPRSFKAYGYSPVEQIITIVNMGLRREMSQLQFYTEGNIPEAIAATPEGWTPDQIKTYQAYWDSLMEGNTAARRHMKFIPGGMQIFETKSAVLTDAFDEWLARVVLYCFSIPSTAFVKQNNRATADSVKEQAEEEGLVPMMQWLSDLINHLIVTYWGYNDLHFTWQEEESIDPLVQAQVNQIYLTSVDAEGHSVLDANEVRANLGYEAKDFSAIDAAKEEKQRAAMEQMNAGINPGNENKNSPPNAANKEKDGAPGGLETADVKKKTYAKLSATNVARANALSGKITKLLAKTKKKVIKQAIVEFEKAVAEKSFTLRKVDVQNGYFVFEKGTADDISEDLDLDLTAILNITAKPLTQAAREGVENAEEYLNGAGKAIDADVIAEGVGNYHAAELVTKLDDATRDMLAGDIDTAMKEGWTTDELAGKLSENYAFSEARAQTIARTEIAFADMQGSMETYRASGVVTGKKVLLAENPCPICEENANDGIIDLDEDFSSGDDAAPFHPNCECTVTPIIAEEDEE